jgi:hypothetical protein
MEALETQVFFLYDKAFSLSIYFPCILFFFFGLMMASIEDHNIQPPYLLVNKLSQLTYTLMDFSEFYRHKEKRATLVKIPPPPPHERASWHQCENFH